MKANQVVRSPHRRHERQYFYKYVTAETARAILQNATRRWNSPVNFNDQFDVPRILQFGYTPAELSAGYHEELVKAVEAGAQDPPRASSVAREFLKQVRVSVASGRATFAEFARTLRENTDEIVGEPTVGFQVLQEMWDGLIPDLRILCMCARPDSAVMWATYGEDSAGALLEFEALDEVNSPLVMLREVDYKDDPPKLISREQFAQHALGVIELDYQNFFSEYQYTKMLQWKHEEEWRVVSYALNGEHGTHSDRSFHPRELRRMVFGPKMRDTERRPLVDLLRESRWEHVLVEDAMIDHASRRFVYRPAEYVR